MRRRFFLIILVVLTTTLFVGSVLQQLYTMSERERAVDQRLETFASSLLASGLSLDLIENMDSTDDLISDLLGEERADLIINVYATNGEILAQNSTGSNIPLEFSPQDGFKTVDVEGKKVRVLDLQQNRLFIQVGTVFYPSIIGAEFFLNGRFALFLFMIVFLLILSSYVGSRILFEPLTRLSSEFESMSAGLGRKLGQPLSGFVVGSEVSKLSRGSAVANDEFAELIRQIESFLLKLGDYTSSFNAQTAVLTHELKTPLTVLKNDLQKLSSVDSPAAKEIAAQCTAEIDRLAVLINGFLQWSVLTSNPGEPNELYAVKLNDVVTRLTSSLNSTNDGRISVYLRDGPTLVAIPHHVEQLVNNLVSNALRYSSKLVRISVNGNVLTVSDDGEGIPPSVLEHLGRPFNRGPGRESSLRGSGLGLAWVKALCEKYDWKLAIQSANTGTTITVTFP